MSRPHPTPTRPAQPTQPIDRPTLPPTEPERPGGPTVLPAGYHPVAAHILPFPEDPSGPRWGPAVVVGPPKLAILTGGACGWCDLPVGPTPVTEAGVRYCSAKCADRGRHACGDCGGDIRTPAVAGPMLACADPAMRGAA